MWFGDEHWLHLRDRGEDEHWLQFSDRIPFGSREQGGKACSSLALHNSHFISFTGIDPGIDPGGLVRCTDAPPVRICNVYDICELAEAENRAGKASDGPEHGPRGRSPNRVVVGPRQACS